MVRFILGCDKEKRLYFRQAGYLLIDNDEVVYARRVCDREYFALAKPPFADFSAAETVRYARALSSGADFRALAESVGIKPNRLMSKLNAAERRAVWLFSRTGGSTTRKIALNLDGVKYSRASARSLAKLLLAFRENDIAVLISDTRFAQGRLTETLGALSNGRKPPRRRKIADRKEFFSTCNRMRANRVVSFKIPIARDSIATALPELTEEHPVEQATTASSLFFELN